MPQTFVVEYGYRTDTTLQDQHRPAHLEYLEDRVAAGELLISGPRGDGEANPGGILVYRATDRAALDRIVAADPFVREGVVVECSVHSWLPVNGPLAGAFADRP